MSEIQGQIMMADVAAIVEEGEKKQYTAFVDKFKPAKTTDDCYTPQCVYDALAEWVEATYGYPRERFVRPFWPGGDYRAHEYPEGCAVVDNPPFSILSQIMAFYNAKGVPFFLFGPTLTLIGNLRGEKKEKLCVLLVGNGITYENGAVVNTSYVTNMDKEYALRIEPALRHVLEEVNKQNVKKDKKELPKYIYPPEIISGAAYQLAKYGQTLRIPKDECAFIATMDEQRNFGKSIFGGGLILSERAAAERAAAERALAAKWELSDREKRIIASLSKTVDEKGAACTVSEALRF